MPKPRRPKPIDYDAPTRVPDLWESGLDLGVGVLAILASDIHLSHKTPVVRSPEPDWYAAMDRTLGQLRDLEGILDAPVIIAGDLFDKWNAPAQLINFAFDALPKRVYAVPGQHDLPHHSYSHITESAYWTLVTAKRITNLWRKDPVRHGDRDLVMYGHPWGFDIHPPQPTLATDCITLAVVHRYIWKKGAGYAGADPEKRVGKYGDALSAYDAAVFGDNHRGFKHGKIMNCGTFMRRKADEMEYQPRVGLLTETGHIIECYLDTSDDKYIDIEEALEIVEKAVDMTEFVGALAALHSDSLDFVSSIKRFLDKNNIASSVRERIMEAMPDDSTLRKV